MDNIGEVCVKGFCIDYIGDLPDVEPKFSRCGLRGDNVPVDKLLSTGI